MPAASQQAILDALGLTAINAQAQRAWNWAETAVLEFLGVKFLNQQTITEYYPQDEGSQATTDPAYVLNSSASKAVPGSYFSPRIIALKQTPVRSITNVWEDPSGYFGQVAGSFPSNTVLIQGSDYFLKMDEDGVSWTGHLVRRSFWFPATIGSIKVTYVAGFTDAELSDSGRWNCFQEAVCIAAQDKYLRMKAVAGGQMPELASESLGGGASYTSRDQHTYGLPIPDQAADLLFGYVNYDNEAL